MKIGFYVCYKEGSDLLKMLFVVWTSGELFLAKLEFMMDTIII